MPQGIRELYQQHHNVVLPDEVLKAADYSVQYIPQRSLPDKAIDLVGVTAAHLAATPSDRCTARLSTNQAETKQEEAAAKKILKAALMQKFGSKNWKNELLTIPKKITR